MKEHLIALAQLLEKYMVAQADLNLTTAKAMNDFIALVNDLPDEPVEPEPTPEPLPEPEPTPPEESYFDQMYPPSAGAVTIYVSSSEGADTNNGLTPDAPVETVAKGISLLRNGQPDRLLFKRGDVWVGQSFGNLLISGRAAHEPMVFGTYGDVTKARPLFDTVDLDGVRVYPRGNPPREPTSINYLVFCGLHFYCSGRDYSNPGADSASSPAGFYWINGTHGLVIDDCKFEYYKMNVVLQTYAGTTLQNITVRNCGIFNAYSHSPNSGHSQGLYADGVTNLVIDSCMFDKNGWNNDAPASEPTIYNHNMYIQKNCSKVTVSNCVVTRASSHGLQLRPGGMARGNFFYRNPINVLLGYDMPDVAGTVEGNVITQGTKITPDLPRSWGIEFHGQNPPSAVIRNNICVNRLDDSPNARSIEFKDRVTYAGNTVYNWPPTGPLDTVGAVYKNPDANLPGGMTAEQLYKSMRDFSMENRTLNAGSLIKFYEDAFQRV